MNRAQFKNDIGERALTVEEVVAPDTSFDTTLLVIVPFLHDS